MASPFPIFINYRRKPDEPAADQFYDYLAASFPGRVFLDKEGIGPGEDFSETLLPRVEDSLVFLALIGPYWLEQPSEAGWVSRLDDPSDYVRREIETAFSKPPTDGQSRLIIPVLLGDAPKPDRERLPDSIKALTGHNYVFYHGSQEHRRVDFRIMVRQIAARLQVDEPPDVFAMLDGCVETAPFNAMGANLQRLPVGLSSNEHSDSETAGDASDLQEIADLLKSLSQGQDSPVWDRLVMWRQGDRWHRTSARVRGRLLKALSRLALQSQNDLKSARGHFDNAKREYPLGDYEGLEAQILWAEAGAGAALKSLVHPVSSEGWLFKAALLLEQGCAQDALSICNRGSWPDTISEDIGRLKARCLLALDRMEDACESAEAVKSRSDSTWMAKTLFGQCLVCRCLADRGLRRGYETNPRPAPRELVRDDDASRKHLDQAAAVFADVLDLPGLNPTERDAVSAWKLASLAMHPGREAAAEAYARSVITGDPKNAAAIAWAAARGWDFEWDSDIIPQVQQAARQSRDFNDWQKLMMMLGSLGRLEAVTKALEEARPDYERAGQSGEWWHLHGQTLALRGQLEEAEALLDSTALDEKQRKVLRDLIRRTRANSPEDRAVLATEMEQEWEAGSEEVSLWELAKAKADAGDGKFIASHADMIVAEVPTASAVHLVAEAFLHQQMPEAGLAWVEQQRALKSGCEFTPGLQRIVIHWKRQLGQISEALELAHAGAKNSGRWQDWLSVIQHGLLQGDFSKVTEGAKGFLRDSSTPPQFLMQAAGLTQSGAARVARELLVKAADKLDPGQPGFFEAIKLSKGLGDVALERALVEKMSVAAASQQIAGSLDDAHQLLLSDFERERATVQDYRNGEFPLFALCKKHSPLPLIFDRAFHLHPQLPNPPPLFLHHGGRGPTEPPSSGAGLYMDISGLLTAWNIQILDQVAAHWGALYLPLPAIEAIAQAEVVLENDARELAATRTFCDLTARGCIQTVPTSDEPSAAPDEDGSQIQSEWEEFLERRTIVSTLIGGASVEVWQVFLALERSGKLTLEQAGRARQMLSSATNESVPPEAQVDAAYSLHQTVEMDCPDLKLLADIGVLGVAVEHFHFVTSAQEIHRAQRVLIRHEWRAEAKERLTALQQWIAAAGEQQRVKLLPVPPSDSAEEWGDDFWHQSLRALLLLKPDQPSFVWVEDRLFNGHGRFGEMTTLSVSDILGALCERGILSEEEWITALYKLRRANVQHLPVHEKEVGVHLRMAKLGERGRLIETPEMQMLRRNVARALRHKSEWLSQPAGSEYRSILGTSPESFWGYWIMRLSAVLVSRWLDRPLQSGDGSLDRAIAESLWILENLWFDGGCEVCPALPGITGNDAMPSLPLLAFLIGARRVNGEAPENHLSPQKVMHHFGAYVFGHSQMAWKQAAARVSRNLANLTNGPEPVDVRRKALQRMISSLPGKLRRHLRFSKPTAEFLRYDRFLEVGEPATVRFSFGEFWSQARRAMSGQPASVQSEDGRTWRLRLVPMSRETSEAPLMTLLCKEDASTFNLTHLGFVALLPDRKRAAAHLLTHRSAFDLSCEGMEKVLQRVLSQPKAEDRIEILTAAWEASAVRHYETLRQLPSLTVQHLLPPSFASLRRFLRLPSEGKLGDFERIWDRSAAILLKEEGLSAAWERLTLLPVRLPSIIMDSLGKMKAKDVDEWIAGVTEVPLSWLQQMFRASVLAQTGRISDVADVMRSLVDVEGRSQVQGFLDLLRWSIKCLLAREECADQPAAAVVACAWAHAGMAHRLLRLTKNGGGPIHDELEKLRLPSGPCLWFGFRRDIEVDACNPFKVDESLLLANGIGTLISEQVWMQLAKDVKQQVSLAVEANCHWTASEGVGGNLLGSFLAARNLKPTAAGFRLLQELDPDNLSDALSRLSCDRAQISEWIVVFAFLHHKDSSWRNHAMNGVRGIIEAHGLKALLRMEGESSRIFRGCLRTTLCFPVNGGNLSWVLPVIIRAATDLNLDALNTELCSELFQCLFNSAYGDAGENSIANLWAAAALQLINASPLIAVWVREHLGVEFHRCTPEEQSDLMPLMLRARELP